MSVEAINSGLQLAPVIRGSSDRTSTAASFGNPAQKAAQGPYVSPIVAFDAKAGIMVEKIRDTQTGDIIQMIPSLPNPTANESDQGSDAAQTITVGPNSPDHNNTPSAVPTAQQVAAFATAVQSGNSDASNINVIA